MNELIQNYGLALFQLSAEENKTDDFYEQLKTIDSSTQKNPDFLKILNLYSLPNETKYEIVDETFKDFDEIILNFLKVASKNHVISKLSKIISVFKEYYYESKNIRRGYIYTTIPLTQSEIRKFESVYAKKHSINLILKNVIDPKLLSGIKVVIDDIVIDNSGLHQLELLKGSILNENK